MKSKCQFINMEGSINSALINPSCIQLISIDHKYNSIIFDLRDGKGNTTTFDSEKDFKAAVKKLRKLLA